MIEKSKPSNDEASIQSLACELITASQLADLLNISERTLYRLKSSGQLPRPIHLGGSVRWRLTDIRDWIDKGCPVPQFESEARATS